MAAGPGGGVDSYVARMWFESVDVDRSGLLDAKELRQALDIGGLDFTLQQAHMLLRAFDSKGNHKLNVNEFVELHRFLAYVYDTFVAAARGSRAAAAADVQEALVRMGYRLDPAAAKALLVRHDTEGRGVFERADFLRMALFLHTAQRTFQAFDANRTGRMELSFNQFCYAAAGLS